MQLIDHAVIWSIRISEPRGDRAASPAPNWLVITRQILTIWMASGGICSNPVR
jgi:hypothetical protein